MWLNTVDLKSLICAYYHFKNKINNELYINLGHLGTTAHLLLKHVLQRTERHLLLRTLIWSIIMKQAKFAVLRYFQYCLSV